MVDIESKHSTDLVFRRTESAGSASAFTLKASDAHAHISVRVLVLNDPPARAATCPTPNPTTNRWSTTPQSARQGRH